MLNLTPQRETLALLSSCAAVVVGGSFAGIAAALELARSGRSVTLVEPRTYLGREITATLRPWLPIIDESQAPTLIASAIKGAGKRQTGNRYALNLDALKIHLEGVLLEAGVKLLYASVVVGVQTDNNALRGVIIGNKSGRQVIGCHLLVDTSETALLARLTNSAFEPVSAEPVPYRRTLEFDNVAPTLDLSQPLVANGISATLHPGYRENGHVLVECALTLNFASSEASDGGDPADADYAFRISERETKARHQTMAFASALAHQVPAFESAYLSGASYELYGQHAPRMKSSNSLAHQGVSFMNDTIECAGEFSPVSAFAGSIRGLWHLNEAVPLDTLAQEAFYDPVVTSQLGQALGRYLADHWTQASAPNPASARTPAAAPSQPNPALEWREPESPQRGRPYPRVPNTTNTLPVLREVEVLVVGGGSSGATAAITAAREGMRTVLTEMNPGLGGTGTYGGVHSYWFGRRIGFSERVMKLVDDMHVYLHHPQPKGIIPKWNIEAKSYALLKEAASAGVETLFNAYVVGALVEDGHVRGVVVATRAGIGVIRAQVVIDASGDGDVAAFAGADYVYGSERDHIVMWYALAQFTRPGLTRNHFTSMVDVSNIEDYTRAILAGRRRGSRDEMHDHGIYVAPRESRHVHGDVVLSLTDQLRKRRWEDVIAYPFSNHDVKGHSGSDWLRVGLIPPNLEIEVPYRAILPRHLDNILVVGKAISASHDALPAIRMQADLENLGGAAALAASLAVREGMSLRDISIRQLQARLVSENVLPADVLTRALQPRVYTDAELRAMIAAMPSDFPLYEYSDMELTDIYEGLIPLVEICCAGERVIPLLVEALQTAEGSRRTLLGQALALVGSNAGVPALINAIEPHLKGDTLPPRTAHIRYTQLPPDHGAMPDVVYLLYSLGMVPDTRSLPVWQRVIELLSQTNEQDFYDDMKGVFYYVDAVCYALERLAITDAVPLLRRLHGYPTFHSHASYDGFQPDYVHERIAYLELVIGRTLARCGSADGFVILASYLSDNRAILAEHAHTELVAITGEDFGKDVQAWSRWIEFHGDDLPPVPYYAATEPVQAWSEVILSTNDEAIATATD